MRKIISLVMAFTFFHSQLLYALPVKNNASNGVKFNQNQNTLNITAPDRSVINYDSFDIAAAERVNFIQPSASAGVLNRVLSGGASSINGALSANGNVLLINPSGVMFGGGAKVNANSFIASTKDVSDSNFAAGLLKFEGSTNGKIVNAGLIEATTNVGLIAANIENKGNIKAGKNVGLIAGNKGSISVDFEGDGLVNFAADSSAIGSGEITNSGTIKAGQVLLTANDVSDVLKNVINNTGTIEATKAVAGENGSIMLVTDASVKNAGTLKAPEGEIVLKTGGDMNSEGTISAVDGDVDIEATGDVTSSGTLEAGTLTETGATFGISGIFSAEQSSMKNDDAAIEFTGDTTITGDISDVDNIIVGGSGTDLTLGADVTFTAGTDGTGFIWMADDSTIIGAGYDLTINTKGNSWLTSITGVKDLTFENGNADKAANPVSYEIKKNVVATGTMSIGESVKLHLYPIDGTNAAISDISFTADNFQAGGTGENAGSISLNEKNLTLNATGATADSNVNFYVNNLADNEVSSAGSLHIIGNQATTINVGVAGNDTASDNKIITDGIVVQNANVALASSISELSATNDVGAALDIHTLSTLILGTDTRLAGKSIQMSIDSTIDGAGNSVEFYSTQEGVSSNLASLNNLNNITLNGEVAGSGVVYALGKDIDSAGTFTAGDNIEVFLNPLDNSYVAQDGITLKAANFVANGTGETAGHINTNHKNLTLDATSTDTDSAVNFYVTDQAGDTAYSAGSLTLLGNENTKFDIGVANNDTANGNKIVVDGITLGSDTRVANVNLSSSLSELSATGDVGGNLTLKNGGNATGSKITLNGNTTLAGTTLQMDAGTVVDANSNNIYFYASAEGGSSNLATLSNVIDMAFNGNAAGIGINYAIREDLVISGSLSLGEAVKLFLNPMDALNNALSDIAITASHFLAYGAGEKMGSINANHKNVTIEATSADTNSTVNFYVNDQGSDVVYNAGSLTLLGNENTTMTVGVANNDTASNNKLMFKGVTIGSDTKVANVNVAASVGEISTNADSGGNFTLKNGGVVNGSTVTLNGDTIITTQGVVMDADTAIDANDNDLTLQASANSTVANLNNVNNLTLTDTNVDGNQIQYDILADIEATVDLMINDDVKVRANKTATPTTIKAANLTMGENTQINAWQDTSDPAIDTHGSVTLDVSTEANLGEVVCIEDLTLTGGARFYLDDATTNFGSDGTLTVGANTDVTLASDVSLGADTITMAAGSTITGAGNNLEVNAQNASTLGAISGVNDLVTNNTTYTIFDSINASGAFRSNTGSSFFLADSLDIQANSFDMSNINIDADGNNLQFIAGANSILGTMTNLNDFYLMDSAVDGIRIQYDLSQASITAIDLTLGDDVALRGTQSTTTINADNLTMGANTQLNAWQDTADPAIDTHNNIVLDISNEATLDSIVCVEDLTLKGGAVFYMDNGSLASDGDIVLGANGDATILTPNGALIIQSETFTMDDSSRISGTGGHLTINATDDSYLACIEGIANLHINNNTDYFLSQDISVTGIFDVNEGAMVIANKITAPNNNLTLSADYFDFYRGVFGSEGSLNTNNNYLTLDASSTTIDSLVNLHVNDQANDVVYSAGSLTLLGDENTKFTVALANNDSVTGNKIMANGITLGSATRVANVELSSSVSEISATADTGSAFTMSDGSSLVLTDNATVSGKTIQMEGFSTVDAGGNDLTFYATTEGGTSNVAQLNNINKVTFNGVATGGGSNYNLNNNVVTADDLAISDGVKVATTAGVSTLRAGKVFFMGNDTKVTLGDDTTLAAGAVDGTSGFALNANSEIDASNNALTITSAASSNLNTLSNIGDLTLNDSNVDGNKIQYDLSQDTVTATDVTLGDDVALRATAATTTINAANLTMGANTELNAWKDLTDPAIDAHGNLVLDVSTAASLGPIVCVEDLTLTGGAMYTLNSSVLTLSADDVLTIGGSTYLTLGADLAIGAAVIDMVAGSGFTGAGYDLTLNAQNASVIQGAFNGVNDLTFNNTSYTLNSDVVIDGVLVGNSGVTLLLNTAGFDFAADSFNLANATVDANGNDVQLVATADSTIGAITNSNALTLTGNTSFTTNAGIAEYITSGTFALGENANLILGDNFKIQADAVAMATGSSITGAGNSLILDASSDSVLYGSMSGVADLELRNASYALNDDIAVNGYIFTDSGAILFLNNDTALTANLFDFSDGTINANGNSLTLTASANSTLNAISNLNNLTLNDAVVDASPIQYDLLSDTLTASDLTIGNDVKVRGAQSTTTINAANLTMGANTQINAWQDTSDPAIDTHGNLVLNVSTAAALGPIVCVEDLTLTGGAMYTLNSSVVTLSADDVLTIGGSTYLTLGADLAIGADVINMAAGSGFTGAGYDLTFNAQNASNIYGAFNGVNDLTFNNTGYTVNNDVVIDGALIGNSGVTLVLNRTGFDFAADSFNLANATVDANGNDVTFHANANSTLGTLSNLTDISLTDENIDGTKIQYDLMQNSVTANNFILGQDVALRGASDTTTINATNFTMGANTELNAWKDLTDPAIDAHGNVVLNVSGNAALGTVVCVEDLTLTGGGSFATNASLDALNADGDITLGANTDLELNALTTGISAGGDITLKGDSVLTLNADDTIVAAGGALIMEDAGLGTNDAKIAATDKNLIIKSKNAATVYDVDLGLGDLTFEGTDASAVTFTVDGVIVCSNSDTPSLINAVIAGVDPGLITAATAGWSLDGTTMVYSGNWVVDSGDYSFENTVTGIKIDAGAEAGLFNFIGGTIDLGNIVSFVTAGDFTLGNDISLTFGATATITVGGNLNMGTNAELTTAGDTTVTANAVNMSAGSTVDVDTNNLTVNVNANSTLGTLENTNNVTLRDRTVDGAQIQFDLLADTLTASDLTVGDDVKLRATASTTTINADNIYMGTASQINAWQDTSDPAIDYHGNLILNTSTDAYLSSIVCVQDLTLGGGARYYLPSDLTNFGADGTLTIGASSNLTLGSDLDLGAHIISMLSGSSITGGGYDLVLNAQNASTLYGAFNGVNDLTFNNTSYILNNDVVIDGALIGNSGVTLILNRTGFDFAANSFDLANASINANGNDVAFHADANSTLGAFANLTDISLTDETVDGNQIQYDLTQSSLTADNVNIGADVKVRGTQSTTTINADNLTMGTSSQLNAWADTSDPAIDTHNDIVLNIGTRADLGEIVCVEDLSLQGGGTFYVNSGISTLAADGALGIGVAGDSTNLSLSRDFSVNANSVYMDQASSFFCSPIRSLTITAVADSVLSGFQTPGTITLNGADFTLNTGMILSAGDFIINNGQLTLASDLSFHAYSFDFNNASIDAQNNNLSICPGAFSVSNLGPIYNLNDLSFSFDFLTGPGGGSARQINLTDSNLIASLLVIGAGVELRGTADTTTLNVDTLNMASDTQLNAWQDLTDPAIDTHGNFVLNVATAASLGEVVCVEDLTLEGGGTFTTNAGVSALNADGDLTIASDTELVLGSDTVGMSAGGDITLEGDATLTLNADDTMLVAGGAFVMEEAGAGTNDAKITADDKNLIIKSEGAATIYDIDLGVGDLTFEGTDSSPVTFTVDGTILCSNLNTPTGVNADIDMPAPPVGGVITAATAGWSLDGTTMVYSGDWVVTTGDFSFENAVTGIRVDAGFFNFIGGTIDLGNIVSFVTAGDFTLGNDITLRFNTSSPITITAGGTLTMGSGANLTTPGDTIITANTIDMNATASVNFIARNLTLKVAGDSTIGNVYNADKVEIDKINAGDTPTYTQAGSIVANRFELNEGITYISDTNRAFMAAGDFVLADGSVFKRFAGGDGTSAATAYQIVDIYGLQGMDTDLASDYQLNNNIDATMTNAWNGGKGFNPIGAYELGVVDDYFSGDFDGQNFNIDGLYINRPDESNVGLFGQTEGLISNVSLSNVDVTGRSTVGGLVGMMDGPWALGVDNCSVASGSVTGKFTVGGLIGYSAFSTVANSSSAADVEGIYAPSATFNTDGMWIGGLVGHAYYKVNNSHATGNVVGKAGVGGLIGTAEDFVDNSYATGNVTGETSVGGLIGSTYVAYAGTTISDSYATGNVSGNTGVGGLIGSNGGAEVENCSYSTGVITGTTDVGGLVGDSSAITDIADNLATPVYNNNTWNSDEAKILNNTDVGNIGDVVGITDSGTYVPPVVPVTPDPTPQPQNNPAPQASPQANPQPQPEPTPEPEEVPSPQSSPVAKIIKQVQKQVQTLVLQNKPEVPGKGTAHSPAAMVGQIKKLASAKPLNLGSLISSVGSIFFGAGIMPPSVGLPSVSIPKPAAVPTAGPSNPAPKAKGKKGKRGGSLTLGGNIPTPQSSGSGDEGDELE